MTARVSIRFFSVALAATFLVFAAGCGGKKGSVEGTVTGPDKQPLPAGRIAFHGEKGNPVSGPIENGKYKVTGAPAGDNIKVTIETAHLEDAAKRHKVLVTKIKELEADKLKFGDKFNVARQKELDENIKQEVDLAKEAAKYRAIDKKYTDKETTPLKIKVSGSTTENITIE